MTTKKFEKKKNNFYFEINVKDSEKKSFKNAY